MKSASMPRRCGMCQSLGTACENCVAEAEFNQGDAGDMEDGGRGRIRSKSPLLNSAERPGKALRVNISTPLAECPLLPPFIPEGGQKGGDNGKGESAGKNKNMGGEKGDQGKGGHKGKEGEKATNWEMKRIKGKEGKR